MTRQLAAVRIIDRVTVVVLLGVVVVLGARWLRHRGSLPRVAHALTSATAGTHSGGDSTMPLPSGRQLSRLELHDLAETGIAIGDSSPVVQMIVFTDYGCGWCAVFDSTLTEIMAHYPDLVGIVYKPVLLDTLSSALLDVSAASYCSLEQGHFLAFHRAAFANQEIVGGRDAWRRIARTAQVGDQIALERCVLSDRYRESVLTNTRQARTFGFLSTPSAIIGRRSVVGNLSYAALDTLVMLAVSEERARSR